MRKNAKTNEMENVGLILKTAVNETIHLDDDTTILVTEISPHGLWVKIAVKAPQTVKVFRGEVYQRIKAEQEERQKP